MSSPWQRHRLFGSAAWDEPRDGSDVDIGLQLTDPRWTVADRHALLGELAARLKGVVAPLMVVLVQLEHQGPSFPLHALLERVLICESDRARRLDFVADTVLRAVDFRPSWELAQAAQRNGIRQWIRTRS